jgi:uncharacterized protein
MALNNLFSVFLPKDKVFYNLFEQTGRNVSDIGEKLKEFVNEVDPIKRARIHTEMEDLEHRNDEVTHQIFQELGKNFITPFDREDIHYLATAMDDVVDYIYASVKKIHFHEVDSNDDGIKKLADVICEGAKEVSKLIMQLRELKRPEKIMEAIVRINSLENHADKIFDSCIKELFDNENDFKNLIRRREVYTVMEVATDKFEDVANVIETIIVKYA